MMHDRPSRFSNFTRQISGWMLVLCMAVCQLQLLPAVMTAALSLDSSHEVNWRGHEGRLQIVLRHAQITGHQHTVIVALLVGQGSHEVASSAILKGGSDHVLECPATVSGTMTNGDRARGMTEESPAALALAMPPGICEILTPATPGMGGTKTSRPPPWRQWIGNAALQRCQRTVQMLV